MSKVSLVVVAVLLTAGICGAVNDLVLSNSHSSAQVATTQQASLHGELDGISELVNAVRTERGLSPLVLNERLNKSAEAKSNHMVDNSYWEHTAPDGTTAWDFIKKETSYSNAGENLGKCYQTNEALVQAWVDSPTHLENILGDYTEFGFGAAKKDNCLYVTNHFIKL